MAAPGFGFSVGDLITGIELVSKVIKALRKTGGAPFRYIQVLGQLENLGRILHELDVLQPTQDDADFVNAIRGSTRAAQFPLSDFLTKIEKYEPALNPINRSKVASRAVKAAKWSILVEAEVEKLQNCLAAHLLGINLLMQLRELRVGDVRESRRRLEQEKIVQSLDHQHASLTQVQTAVSTTHSDSQASHQQTLDAIASVRISSQANAQVMGEVRQVAEGVANRIRNLSDENHLSFQRTIQSVVDNTEQLLKLQRDIAHVPALQPDSSINLFDALDRPHKLPYEYFQDFALVQTFLKSKFTNTPGALQVKAGLYQLTREGHRAIIVTSENWQKSVFPGSRVSMAVMLSSLRIPKNRCPRPSCHQENETDATETRIVKCERCGLIYWPYSPRGLGGPHSELTKVLDHQRKEDRVHFGTKLLPYDLSVVASISNQTLSQLAASSTTRSSYSRGPSKYGQCTSTELSINETGEAALLEEGVANTLTADNLLLLQEVINEKRNGKDTRDDLPAMATGQITLPVIDWMSGPSGLLAWLNQSAIPEHGGYPPILENLNVDYENENDAIDEEEDIEILRRVCVPRSMPSAKHYLDAPEYENLDHRVIPYLRKIVDRFPKLQPVIALRLGERNLQRNEKLVRIRKEHFHDQYLLWQNPPH